MSTITYPLTPARAGSAVLAAIASGLRSFGLGLWRFLEAVGQARAERELSAIADSIEASHPAVAARLRRGYRANWL